MLDILQYSFCTAHIYCVTLQAVLTANTLQYPLMFWVEVIAAYFAVYVKFRYMTRQLASDWV